MNPITTIEVAGESIELSLMTIGALSKVLPLLAPIIEAAHADAEQNWLEALETNVDQLALALAFATNKPVSWVEGLILSDFIDLAQAVFRGYAAHLRRTVIPKTVEG